jgi:Flp pilus assembly CpaF family ATPase
MDSVKMWRDASTLMSAVERDEARRDMCLEVIGIDNLPAVVVVDQVVAVTVGAYGQESNIHSVWVHMASRERPIEIIAASRAGAVAICERIRRAMTDIRIEAP